MEKSIYTNVEQLSTGETVKFETYKNKVLLIVNTASKCGFTPQYQGLQELHDAFREQGFEVLGFPCDQFGHQEPGSDAEIQKFCSLTYNVTFPMFKKSKLMGPKRVRCMNTLNLQLQE